MDSSETFRNGTYEIQDHKEQTWQERQVFKAVPEELRTEVENLNCDEIN